MIIINVIDSIMVMTDVVAIGKRKGEGKGKGKGKGKINPFTILGSLDFKVIAGAKGYEGCRNRRKKRKKKKEKKKEEVRGKRKYSYF